MFVKTANSKNTDQTAPSGPVCFRSSLIRASLLRKGNFWKRASIQGIRTLTSVKMDMQKSSIY